MVFYLVRHAHAEWSPDENRPLSARGLQDSLAVADLLDSFSVHRVISSPYQRAVQTVEPFAKRKGLEIRKCVAFRERILGLYSDTTFSEAVRRTWEDPNFAYRHGETNREAQSRGVNGIRELLDEEMEGSIVVGTHGNLLALILNHYDQSLGYSFWVRLTMPDIYLLEVGKSGKTQIQRIWNG